MQAFIDAVTLYSKREQDALAAMIKQRVAALAIPVEPADPNALPILNRHARRAHEAVNRPRVRR